MSNERIDLTQFEGSYLPPWSVHRGRTGIWQVKGLRADQEHNRPVKVVDVYGTDEDSRQKNAEIIAAVPDLIAELKRCYEQLDAVKHEVENCSECGGHREEEGTFHYCQNYCRCEEFDASE